MREWNNNSETPWKRKLHFIPQKYESLLDVPAYKDFVQERFTRCLDLYLCPRSRKMRVNNFKLNDILKFFVLSICLFRL